MERTKSTVHADGLPDQPDNGGVQNHEQGANDGLHHPALSGLGHLGMNAWEVSAGSYGQIDGIAACSNYRGGGSQRSGP